MAGLTPEEQEELLRKYQPNRDKIDPEVKKQAEEAIRYMEEKIERGEVLKSWSKDPILIGLDSNLEPFPLTEKNQEHKPTNDKTSEPE